MVTIEVDEEVYGQLKNMAEPFVDTPNSVLRKILFSESKPSDLKTSTIVSTAKKSPKQQEVLSEAFMSSFIKKRYGGIFQTKSPYRTMFESQTHLVYFQNFNKSGTSNLWYRLSERALTVLRETQKTALVCFTNPSENTVFEIPMKDIDIQAGKANWQKEFLEVNIDPANSRWRELDWNIDKYLIKA
jgi:hypothetical protein